MLQVRDGDGAAATATQFQVVRGEPGGRRRQPRRQLQAQGGAAGAADRHQALQGAALQHRSLIFIQHGQHDTTVVFIVHEHITITNIVAADVGKPDQQTVAERVQDPFSSTESLLALS